jgi:hypothetical protein
MLTLFPAAAFLTGMLLLGNLSGRLPWRVAFMRAAILWGVYAVAATELLSLVHGITPLGLAIAWALPVVFSGGWLLRRRRQHTLRYPRLNLPAHPLEWVLVLGLGVILALTALVAWLAPPQTWDSLNYHLPRVAHWAQEGAVRHFATGIDKQNSMSPGAEITILHLYVLAGGDRLANFPAWSAIFGSILAASWVARQLGGGRTGQLLAAVVAATIPMGLVQASSTMTDAIVAFWVICAVSETLRLRQAQAIVPPVIFSSLAAGLGLLTKPTAAVFLLPFALLAGLFLLRRASLRQTARWAGLAAGLVLLVNAGYLGRNYALYGNPLSGEDRISLHANGLPNGKGLASNLLRNAALHTGSPWPAINTWIYDTVLKAHIKLGVDIQDPRTTLIGPYRPMTGLATGEDLVGNLVHSLLILLTAGLTLLWGRRLGALPVGYMLAAAGTFVLYSLVFKWQIFASRLHFPFFVLFAPLVGYTLARLFHPNTARLTGIILLLSSLPWLLSINSRPLFPLPNRSLVGSVLTEPRMRLLFANGLDYEGPFETMTGMVQGAGCDQIGVALSGHGAEYPLWVLLGAPQAPVEIEWLVGGNPSERYADPVFQPCAVICQKCPDSWDTVRGLPKVYDDTRFRLYLGSP